MAKNPYGRTRAIEAPYMIFMSEDTEWEIRVLKTYKTPENEAKDPYARWFCATRSPYTMGGWEWGDSYVKDIREKFIQVL